MSFKYRIKQWFLFTFFGIKPNVFIGYNPILHTKHHTCLNFVVKTLNNELTIVPMYVNRPEYLTWNNEIVLKDIRETLERFNLKPIRLTLQFKGRVFSHRLT